MLKKNLDVLNTGEHPNQNGKNVGISKRQMLEDQEVLDVELTNVEANGAPNTARQLLGPVQEGCEHEPAEVKRGVPTGEFDNDWKLSYKLSLRAEALQYSKLMNYIEKQHPLDPDTKRKYSYCSAPLVLKGLLNRLFNPCYCCLVNSNRNGRAKKVEAKEQPAAEAGNQEAEDARMVQQEEESDPDDDQAPSLQIGEGSTFYLQHLRALTCLFFILAAINVPIIAIFVLNENGPAVDGAFNAISFFSIANIGESTLGCAYDTLDIGYTKECCDALGCPASASFQSKPQPAKGPNGITIAKQRLVLKCPSGGKISAINEFGFLNPKDYQRKNPVDPAQICSTATDPTYWPETSWNVFSTATEYEKRYQQQEKAKKDLGYEFDQVNEYNVDNECQFNKMFKTPALKTQLHEHVKKNCIGSAACHIDLDMGLPFFDELSCECRARVAKGEASKHLSVFFQCSAEDVGVQLGKHLYDDPSRLDFNLHRSAALLVYYAIDFLGICFIFRAIVGLQKLNGEKYRLMQENMISASDYTFQIEGVTLDKYSQNLQILQMKLWLHLLDYFKVTKVFEHEEGQHKEDGSELVEQDLEILDINVNTKHASELDDILVQMQAIEQGKNYIGRRVQKKFTTMEEYDMYMNIYDELQGNYVKKKEQYKEIVKTRHENNEDFKRVPADKRIKQVDQIYVTMSHRHFAQKVHQQWPTKAPKFQDQILKVGEAPDPDQILWSNQQVAFRARRYRTCFLVFQLIFFIAAALAANYFLILKQREYEKAGNVSELMQCSEFKNWASLEEFKDQAITQYSQLKQQKEKEGITDFSDLGEIGCYCKHLKENTDEEIEKVKFEGQGDRLFCKEWADQQQQYFWIRLVYPVLIVFIVNGVVAYLLAKGVANLRINTISRHSRVEFLSIFVFECISIGFAFLVTTAIQQAQDEPLAQWHRGLDYAWYQEFGATVCMVIVLSIFSSNCFEWLRYFGKACVRCKDRGGRCGLRTPPGKDETESNGVRSKQRTQQQLNSLYEGVDFEIVKTYARMNSIIFVTLMFAPGMPLLYVIGFLWCLFTYVTQKFMILFFYKREMTLKKELADMSVLCLIWSALAHIIVAFIMLQNSAIRQSFGRHSDIESEHDDLLLKYFDHDKPWFRYVDYEKEMDLGIVQKIRIELAKSINGIESMVFVGLLLLTLIALLLVLAAFGCSRGTPGMWAIQKHQKFDQVKKDYKNLPVQSEAAEENARDNQIGQIEDQPADPNKDMHTIDGRIDLVAEKERATAKGDEVMSQLSKTSILNEMNGGNLKDFYMRSIFQLYNFKRMFQEVNPVGQSVNEFNINFSLLEDNQIKNEIMNAVKQASEINSKRSELGPGPREAEPDSAVKVEEVADKAEHVFKDMCDFYQVTTDQVKKYQAILNKRVHMIESVIDQHFNVIKQLMIKEELDGSEEGHHTTVKKELLRKLEDITYLEKLNYIILRQDELIKSNIVDIGNPLGKANIMRLRGSLQNSMVQSYFKFDSREFNLTKKIYYALESELVREQDEEDARKYLSFLRQEEEIRNGERIEEVDEEHALAENMEEDSQINGH